MFKATSKRLKRLKIGCWIVRLCHRWMARPAGTLGFMEEQLPTCIYETEEGLVHLCESAFILVSCSDKHSGFLTTSPMGYVGAPGYTCYPRPEYFVLDTTKNLF